MLTKLEGCWIVEVRAEPEPDLPRDQLFTPLLHPQVAVHAHNVRIESILGLRKVDHRLTSCYWLTLYTQHAAGSSR